MTNAKGALARTGGIEPKLPVDLCNNPKGRTTLNKINMSR